MLRDHAGPLRLTRTAWIESCRRLLLTLWVGSLWSVGYLVAPALFALVTDRALAGRVAGELFHMELWVTLSCAPVFLLLELLERRGALALTAPVLIAAAQLIIELLLRPRIAAASPGSDAFAWLHGGAAILYLFASLLGLALVLVPRRSNA